MTLQQINYLLFVKRMINTEQVRDKLIHLEVAVA